MKTLELLSPAKNGEFGRVAIDHGADAVYIGAPSYGARVAAGNSLEEISSLVRYAHQYRAKVYATVNTVLFDSEIDDAVAMIWRLYEEGVDALIVQDLGLLECNLPPIALHASTQTHNASPERVRFLQQAGFHRVILARETSLEEMLAIRRQTAVELEAFVHGALCVSYSGQCYMSQYLNGRSGNRGCCGQPCRSTYDLYNEQGKLLRKEEHLLSLKDFNASQSIADMIDAGICSFKIEGRLKDMSYVKNVTAYYRSLIDACLEGRTDMRSVASGKVAHFFMPDIERTFNRGYTSYFLTGRQSMASIATQKSIGKPVGKVLSVGRNSLTLKSKESFVAGDGCCFLGKEGRLEGFNVNHVNGTTLFPNRMPDIAVGTLVYRNHDFAFEKLLQGKTAERKVGVAMVLEECPKGLALHLVDEDGYEVRAEVECLKEPALQPERAKEQIERQLSKLGDSIFRPLSVENRCETLYFIPAAVLNELRRKAIVLLVDLRVASARVAVAPRHDEGVAYFEPSVDYRANVVNRKAELFYRNHHAEVVEQGLEQSLDYNGKALMTTRYCLRYELGQCLMHKANHEVSHDYQGNLYLRNNKNLFLLHFDCKACQMQVVKNHNTKLLWQQHD